MEAAGQSNQDLNDPLLVVSCDSHIGPTLEQMRAYCPAKYLAAYDEETRMRAEARSAASATTGTHGDRYLRTAGHNDMTARMRDLDRDGVAAEVVFHGSANGEPIPFMSGGIPTLRGAIYGSSTDPHLGKVGQHIYNQWLADALSTEPERHVGLVHVPMWDVPAALEELKWGHENGLKAVNFPPPREGISSYDRQEWEPFWSACEDYKMPIVSHTGGQPLKGDSPNALAIWCLEAQQFKLSALPVLILSGVFQRHPGLNYVLTELLGEFWTQTARDVDYYGRWNTMGVQLERRPSEYLDSNVFVAGSILSNLEANNALDEGYINRLGWGSDYPHPEGTWQFAEDDDETPASHLAMRFAFAGVRNPTLSNFSGFAGEFEVPDTKPIPDNCIPLVLGENALRMFDLDEQKLREVAVRINSPTIAQLKVPLDSIPADGGSRAFRLVGPTF